jgi:hypothetical protein
MNQINRKIIQVIEEKFLFDNLVSLFVDDKDTPKKPNQSYLEIIAEAILKAPNRTMQLYEIYNYFQRK